MRIRKSKNSGSCLYTGPMRCHNHEVIMPYAMATLHNSGAMVRVNTNNATVRRIPGYLACVVREDIFFSSANMGDRKDEG